MLLAPRVDLTANAHVGDKYFVHERLVVEGRGVGSSSHFSMSTRLYVWPSAATTGSSIRVHSNAMSFSSSAAKSVRAQRGGGRATGAPGASERAALAEFGDVMVVVCFVKCKQLQKLMGDELSSAFMVRTGAAGAVEAGAGRQGVEGRMWGRRQAGGHEQQRGMRWV